MKKNAYETEMSFHMTKIMFIVVINTFSLTQYCAGDKIEKNEMGGSCGTYGGRERCVQGFGVET